MAAIKDVVWRMQNQLRADGITGIDAMHHITMIMLSKSFNEEQCIRLNIPIEYAFDNMINLDDTTLFVKFYNDEDFDNCLFKHIRDNEKFGYMDITFQINRAFNP